MSTNVSALDQAQAVAPAPVPVPGSPNPADDPSSSFANNDGLQDGVQQAHNILGPAATPIFTITEVRKWLANVIAVKGPAVGAYYAAAYHLSTGKDNPPTVDELLLRLVDTQAFFRNKKKALYHKHNQGSPNSVALRLLADRAGDAYPLDVFETDGNDNEGNPMLRWKICRGCGNTGPDYKRHMAGTHVKDPVDALCCPYLGCNVVCFGASSRNSEMAKHIAGHKRCIDTAQEKGRIVTMPLSTYRLYHTPGRM